MKRRPVLMKVNIPFCVRKCEFCTRDIIEGWNSSRMHSYMQALQKEIAANAPQFEDCEIQAIHFGGGIASLASGEDVSDTCRMIRARYHVADNAPLTMRASIANISGASMPFFRRAGVTRFDFEIMSLNPFDFPKLNSVDRLDDLPIISDNFLHAYANNSLGMVLIYGKAGMTLQNFRRCIIAFVRSHAAHLILQRYEGCDVLSEEEVAAQLKEAREVLSEHGFNEYAPFFFAKTGEEDRYTLMRREGMETLAFGLGAKTYFDNAKSTNTMDLETYLAHSSDFSKITIDVEPLASTKN